MLAAAFGISEAKWLAAILSLTAAASQLAGMLVERWLFFAEAKHTVTLYYGH
jgi:DMSO reductase anchor subunit